MGEVFDDFLETDVGIIDDTGFVAVVCAVDNFCGVLEIIFIGKLCEGLKVDFVRELCMLEDRCVMVEL